MMVRNKGAEEKKIRFFLLLALLFVGLFLPFELLMVSKYVFARENNYLPKEELIANCL